MLGAGVALDAAIDDLQSPRVHSSASRHGRQEVAAWAKTHINRVLREAAEQSCRLGRAMDSTDEARADDVARVRSIDSDQLTLRVHVHLFALVVCNGPDVDLSGREWDLHSAVKDARPRDWRARGYRGKVTAIRSDFLPSGCSYRARAEIISATIIILYNYNYRNHYVSANKSSIRNSS